MVTTTRLREGELELRQWIPGPDPFTLPADHYVILIDAVTPALRLLREILAYSSQCSTCTTQIHDPCTTHNACLHATFLTSRTSHCNDRPGMTFGGILLPEWPGTLLASFQCPSAAPLYALLCRMYTPPIAEAVLPLLASAPLLQCLRCFRTSFHTRSTLQLGSVLGDGPCGALFTAVSLPRIPHRSRVSACSLLSVLSPCFFFKMSLRSQTPLRAFPRSLFFPLPDHPSGSPE